MRLADRELSLTDWVVLALVGERTTHGFDVARELQETGPIGRIWTVRRPLVYRSLDGLLQLGMVIEIGTVHGGRGPRRRLLEVTAAGRTALDRWIETPVHHIRDVRTELLLKLALLARAGRSPATLVEGQRRAFAPMIDALHDQLDDADGFDVVLGRWRVESADAVRRFLDSF